MKSLIVFYVAALSLNAAEPGSKGDDTLDANVSTVSTETPAPLPFAENGSYGDDGSNLEPENEDRTGGRSSITGGRNSTTGGKSSKTGGESSKTGGESGNTGGESSKTGGKGSGGQDDK